MRLKIKVPATVRHLGPGYQSLGLALSLYNEYYFEPAKTWEFVGFPESLSNPDNLVVSAMKQTFQKKNQRETFFKITNIQCIPVKKGLGSSAAAIVAGVIAADYFMNRMLSKNEILNLAASFDQSPTQVAAAIYGSLVSNVQIGNQILAVKYPVLDSMQFTIAIPNQTAKTDSFKPVSASFPDILYSLSRAINIPYALENADLNLLFDLMDDRLHIPLSHSNSDIAVFESFCQKNRIPHTLCSDGPSFLMVSKEIIVPRLRELPVSNSWEYIVLNASSVGVVSESIL